MIKKRIRQFLAGICTILVLPIGPVCEVFAKEKRNRRIRYRRGRLVNH